MKTIGLLGGLTPESTVEYYKLLNDGARARLGGRHSARLVVLSVDLGEVSEALIALRWDDAGELLARDAQALEAAGAELFLLCSNTPHNVWEAITAGLTIPALHIGDASGEALARAGHRRVAMLGTRSTMDLPFMRDRLASHGVEPLVPAAEDRELIDRVIFDELTYGDIRTESRLAFIGIIERLAGQGAEAALLACTEIGLLLHDGDGPLPLFDTVRLHVEAALELALGDVRASV
jgi:aspartate racemase